MSNYTWNASDYPVGTAAADAGWAVVAQVAGDAWTIQDESGLRVLRFARTGSTTGERTLQLLAVADEARADAELLAVFMRHDTTQMGLYLAARRDEAGANGYFAGAVLGSNPSARTRKVVAGTVTAIASATVDSGNKIGIWSAVRARINGTTLQAKLWWPADPANPTADEPVAWARTNTDTEVSAAGMVGLYHNDAGHYSIRALAIATGGDTATLGAGGSSEDTTPPTLAGAIAISALASTSYTASWPAAADNVAVTGYEYRIDAGGWVDVGNVLSTLIAGRTPEVTETVAVRAYDAAGNRSAALSAEVTLPAAGVGTVTVGSSTYPIRNAAGTVINESGVRVAVLRASTLAQAWLGTATVAAGVLSVADAALSPGEVYRVVAASTGGDAGLSDEVVAT